MASLTADDGSLETRCSCASRPTAHASDVCSREQVNADVSHGFCDRTRSCWHLWYVFPLHVTWRLADAERISRRVLGDQVLHRSPLSHLHPS